MSKDILIVDNLNMHYETLEGKVMAVNNVTFSVKEGESFGLVGESGCGKSSVAATLLQLQSDNAVISSGSIKSFFVIFALHEANKINRINKILFILDPRLS